MPSCCLYSRQTVLKPFSGPPPTVRPRLKLRRLSANEVGTSTTSMLPPANAPALESFRTVAIRVRSRGFWLARPTRFADLVEVSFPDFPNGERALFAPLLAAQFYAFLKANLMPQLVPVV